MSLIQHAQTMEAKWKLKAPDVFTSDIMEMALVDDDDNKQTEEQPKQTARPDLRGCVVSNSIKG
jgi:hypothetical protein